MASGAKVISQLPADSVQALDAEKSPDPGFELKLTVPVGAVPPPETLAVQAVTVPRGTAAGVQLTVVVVALGNPPEPAAVAVSAGDVPELGASPESPPYAPVTV